MGIGGVVKLADFGELGRLGGAQAQLADACSAPEVLRKVPPPLLAPAQTPRPAPHTRPCHSQTSLYHACTSCHQSPSAHPPPHAPCPLRQPPTYSSPTQG